MAEKKPSKDELILERLDRMEVQLQTLVRAQQSLAELKSDLSPLLNSAFKIMIDELGMVESGFQLEDLWDLVKRGLRSVRNITYVLDQMENIVDLWSSMEPLLKSTVPNFINYMDNLEQKGVFRTYAAMLEVRAKVAQHYPAEEIAAMGDGFVLLLSILKKLSQPKMMEHINKLMDIPLKLDLAAARPVGPVGMLTGMGSKEARQGLGVMLELTKAMGKLKETE